MNNPLPQLGAEGSILEGIVTTINQDGSANISPMGPIVDEQMDRLVLRPFQGSTTYRNLKRTGQGVFHVTDDVELFAQAAIGKLDPLPEMMPAGAVEGFVLRDACRWYAFQVETVDDRLERSEISAGTVDRGRLRDFFGFNRARHAVIEAAILATRVHLLPTEILLEDIKRLEKPLQKTGSRQEIDAFALLKNHIEVTAEETATWTKRMESRR